VDGDMRANLMRAHHLEVLPSVPHGFVLSNDAAPLDPVPQLRDVPDGHGVRGWLFNTVIDMAEARGVALRPSRGYIDFKYYPVRDWMELMVEATRQCYPQLPLRAGLRALGRLAYPRFVTSMIGRVTFGILGNDIARIMATAPKAYEVSFTHSRVSVLDSGMQSVHVRFEHTHAFLDSYHVGAFEGAMDACKRVGEIHVKIDSLSQGELFVRWA
jgi:uncharacterized protein (TIGR02265 family)